MEKVSIKKANKNLKLAMAFSAIIGFIAGILAF